jgi:glyoxylate reductase
MSKPGVYVSTPLQQEVLDAISEVAALDYWPETSPVPPEILRQAGAEVEGIMVQVFDKVDCALLESAPNLKVVSIIGSGTDGVDVATATRKGIAVGNTPGAASKGTADMAMALLLAAARRIPEVDRFLRDGKWVHDLATMHLVGQEVHESTLGIVGLGQIGTEVASRARGFDMNILYHSRTRKQDLEEKLGLEWIDNLPALLERSDFVSLHVRLTAETTHLIGAGELGHMKRNAILVNTSRGPVVDQKALYQALAGGGILGAALDVLEVEPVPMDDPIVALDNVVLSPHLGTDTHGTRLKVAMTAARNLFAGLRGEELPLCVNPEIYARGDG